MDEKQSSGSLGQLEHFFDETNKKLPALPENAKSVIASIAPWAIIIAAILTIPAIIAIFGLSSLFGGYTYLAAITYGPTYYITWVLSVAAFVLEIVAIKGLMDRKLSAWRLVYYSALVSALSSLISLSIASFIIGTAISLYILFQIKSCYKE